MPIQSMYQPAGDEAPEEQLTPEVEGAEEEQPQQMNGAASMSGAHRALIERSRHHNLAQGVEDNILSQIGQRVIEEMQIDETSRSEWIKKSEQAMKLAVQVAETKAYPWPSASNVIYPLMTTGAIQFAARAYPAIVAGRQVVKGVVNGDDRGQPLIAEDGSPAVRMAPNGQYAPLWAEEPGQKRALAEKIGDHMSYQLLEEMEDWEEGTDKMVHILPIVGCVFRKTYFDPTEGYNCSDLVLAENCVINYNAKSVERATRVSEIMRYYPYEIQEMELAGLWLEKDGGYGVSTDGATGDKDAPHIFVEQHRRWDLDEDGYAEPIIVTVHKATGRVVRITARYDEDGVRVSKQGKVVKIVPVHYYTKYDFLPNPDGGIYGIGFGQLLHPINSAINTSLNMMLDAGHLQNSSTGFIGRGLSLHSGSVKFKPFEYKVVNSPGSVVRDAIVPLQFNGPSPVLFQLLGTLIQSGREVASVSDIMTGEAATLAQVQPTTLMALIDQGLKVFTAIYKRIHRALKREYDKLYRLNYLYMDEKHSYRHGDEFKEITREDYRKGGGVAPVSDPSMVSSMQRLAKAQFLLNFKDDPYVNAIEIRRRAFESTEIEGLDQILVDTPPPNPQAQAMEAEMQLKGGELQLKSATARATQIKDLTQAVLNLAKADKENGAADLSWTIGQLDIVKRRLEATNGQGEPAQAAQGGQAGQQQPQGGEPPVPGSRQAKDGNWYVDDPNRPGKYLMVA